MYLIRVATAGVIQRRHLAVKNPYHELLHNSPRIALRMTTTMPTTTEWWWVFGGVSRNKRYTRGAWRAQNISMAEEPELKSMSIWWLYKGGNIRCMSMSIFLFDLKTYRLNHNKPSMSQFQDTITAKYSSIPRIVSYWKFLSASALVRTWT